MVANWPNYAMIVSDIGVGVCFLIMPLCLLRLFIRHQIGHILDGWFMGLSATLVTCAAYLFIHAAQEAGYIVQPLLAALNVLRLAITASATIYLVARELSIERHPELTVNGLEAAMADMKEFVASRGRVNESPDAQRVS